MEKYKKIRQLGEGSFGTVYLVQDYKKNFYALKKISKMNAFVIDDARKQISVMEKLVHPNLIRVYCNYYNQEAQQLEIIMEYCQGGDLLHYFSQKNKLLSNIEILNIFRQIVKAFIALNVKGIMHRDLKPENVLLKVQQQNQLLIKIADFGCAKKLTPQLIQKIDNFTLATGTPIYASPQQLQNEPYSSKCDVWSGGCLLYLLCYGQHPFKDNTVEKTLIKIKSSTQKSQISQPNNSDPILRQIIKLSLIYEDKQRATWRELWLHRFFNPNKVKDVLAFINYLRSISNITNWIIKQFWKVRKNYNIPIIKNQIFAYFLVKFQYMNIMMARDIALLNPQYEYLFAQGQYTQLKNQKKVLNQIAAEVESYQKFFESIKTKLSSQQAYAMIQQRTMKRKSCFSDLDQSIRAAHKILIEVLPKLRKPQYENNIQYVWLVMARWLNFQTWFSYEKQPRVQTFIAQQKSIKNIVKQLDFQLQKYGYGVVE